MTDPLLNGNRHQLLHCFELVKEWIAGYPTIEAMLDAHEQAKQDFIDSFPVAPDEMRDFLEVVVIDCNGEVIYPEQADPEHRIY